MNVFEKLEVKKKGRILMKFKKLARLSSAMACAAAVALGASASAVKYLKLIVIGDYRSGKSEIFHTLMGDEGFSGDRAQNTTNMTHQLRPLQYTAPDGTQEDVRIVAWDTAGEEQYHSLTKTFFRGSSIAFLAIDANQIIKNHLDVDALKHQIERWADETLEVAPDCRIVLTATKCDLISRFDRERLDKELLNTARVMNATGQFALTLLSSAKDQRDQLRQDMENRIKLCIDSIGTNNLGTQDSFPRLKFEDVPIFEEYTEGGGCLSKAVTRTRITGYEKRLVAGE